MKTLTCFNCGSTKHKLVLVYSQGATFWRCENTWDCQKRAGLCAECGRAAEFHHGYEAIPGGKGAMRPMHGFKRPPAIQAIIDAAYP